MKITFSNKKASQKPTKQTSGLFFGKVGTPNRIQFKTGNFDLDTFEKIIGNGHVLSYQCVNDDCMNRKSGYIGTQYIIVDVDAVDYTMDELLDKIKYKPTIIHTSFSNLTEVKNFKYCYHLIYCLNEVIYGEDKFYTALHYFADDYWDIVDENAKDCHRIAYTSNSTLPYYEYRKLGIIYDVNEIIKEKDDNYSDFFGVTNNYSHTLFTPIDNNVSEEKNVTTEKTVKNIYSVDDTFFEDYMSLQYSEFLKKYKCHYTVKYETSYEVEEDKSFVDLTDIDYYIVNPTKYLWNVNSNKWEKRIVKDGNRHNQLFKDAIQFKYVNPNITLEELIISLVDDFYTFYDKTNCSINKKYILDLAKEVLNGDFKGITTDRKRAVNKDYFLDKTFIVDGIEVRGSQLTKQQRNGISARDMKDYQLLSCYDELLSVEENHSYINEYIPHKKARLIEALERNNIEYFTEADNKKDFVIQLHVGNPKKSSRELEKMCIENGFKISYRTICRIIKEYEEKKDIKEEKEVVTKSYCDTLSTPYDNILCGENYVTNKVFQFNSTFSNNFKTDAISYEKCSV